MLTGDPTPMLCPFWGIMYTSGAQVKAAAAAAGTRAPDCYQYVEVDWARTYYTLGHVVSASADTLAMHFNNGSGTSTATSLWPRLSSLASTNAIARVPCRVNSLCRQHAGR